MKKQKTILAEILQAGTKYYLIIPEGETGDTKAAFLTDATGQELITTLVIDSDNKLHIRENTAYKSFKKEEPKKTLFDVIQAGDILEVIASVEKRIGSKMILIRKSGEDNAKSYILDTDGTLHPEGSDVYKAFMTYRNIIRGHSEEGL
jgi:hypothetical protein